MRYPLWVALLVTSWLVVACGAPSAATISAQVDAAQPSLVAAATPEAVLADLSVEASLEASAADLASALGVEPQAVRVRIQTSTCSVCTGQEDAELHAVEGLSLDDATKRLVPGDGFYLFVGEFACFYRYDGATYIPRTCQFAPA